MHERMTNYNTGHDYIKRYTRVLSTTCTTSLKAYYYYYYYYYYKPTFKYMLTFGFLKHVRVYRHFAPWSDRST